MLVAVAAWFWGLEKTWFGNGIISLTASVVLIIWPIASFGLFFSGRDAFAAGAIGSLVSMLGVILTLILAGVFLAGHFSHNRKVDK